jgi:hypothetical protein
MPTFFLDSVLATGGAVTFTPASFTSPGNTAILSKKPLGIEELLPACPRALDWSLEVSLPSDLQPESRKNPKTAIIYTLYRINMEQL